MTTTKDSSDFVWRAIPKALFKSPVVWTFAVLTMIVEIYSVAVLPAYLQTREARIVTAKARIAALLYRADADNAEAKAVTETQIAINASRKQAAEARKAVALADKTKYEADIAKASSEYAEKRAKAEADAQTAQADLIHQREQIQTELNAYVERRKAAEAEIAEATTIIQRYANQLLGADSRPLFTEAFNQQCQTRFEETVGLFLSPKSREDVYKAGRYIALHKAKCGFTREQAQQLITVKQFLDQRVQNNKEKRKSQETQSAEPDRKSIAQGDIGFRVKSDLPDGKLNLRDGPGVRHGILAELPKGTPLRQTGDCIRSDDGVTRDPWCKVDWNGISGWASSSGLEKMQNTGSANNR